MVVPSRRFSFSVGSGNWNEGHWNFYLDVYVWKHWVGRISSGLTISCPKDEFLLTSCLSDLFLKNFYWWKFHVIFRQFASIYTQKCRISFCRGFFLIFFFLLLVLYIFKLEVNIKVSCANINIRFCKQTLVLVSQWCFSCKREILTSATAFVICPGATLRRYWCNLFRYRFSLEIYKYTF